MQKDTMVVVEPKFNRQRAIDGMEIGDSVSISRRIELDYGIAKEVLNKHIQQLRSNLDQQATRAAARNKPSKYTVEVGSFISQSGALNVVAVCSRIL